jgi:hypothetical protein
VSDQSRSDRDRLAEVMGRWVEQGERQETERRLDRARSRLREMLEQAVVDGNPAPTPKRRRSRLPKPKGASKLGLYTHAKLAQAARGLVIEGRTQRDVARHTKMPPQDVLRLRLMLAAEMLRLNADRELVVGVHVRLWRKAGKYALRYFDEPAGAWLDPLRERKGG